MVITVIFTRILGIKCLCFARNVSKIQNRKMDEVWIKYFHKNLIFRKMRRTIISLNRYISDFRSYDRFFSITEIENIREYFMAKT